MRALFDGVRRHRPTLVIIDLADVAVMDAGGVEALATASSSLQRWAAGSNCTTRRRLSGRCRD